MVKKMSVLGFVLFIVTSCCDSYLNEYNVLRSKDLYKKYLDKRIAPADFYIDEYAMYKRINYRYEEENDTFYKIIDSLFISKEEYLRFYSNGSFSIYQIDKITLDSLNNTKLSPEKGGYGFLIENRRGNFIANYSPINCGSFSEDEFEVRNDTLRISSGSNKGYRTWYYYVKYPLGSMNLEGKPEI